MTDTETALLPEQHSSQLGADDWILSKFEKGFKGYFIDVGAADGFSISNTLKLEWNGWKGLAIDAFPRNFEKRTNTVVEQAVLSSVPDVQVTFMIPTEYLDFGGIVNNLGTHRDTLQTVHHTTVELKTSVLSDIMLKHRVPLVIDYMNLDIEGSEYEVLKTFPFDKYVVKHVTVEHNFEEPKRTNVKTLLENKGFFREKEVKWDDWYTHISQLT